MQHRLIRASFVGMVATAILGLATPALAQNGTLTGRVVDSERRTMDRFGQKPLAGKMSPDGQIGLAQATVTFEFKGEPARKFQTITDAFGEYYRSGMPPGTYDISVRLEWRDPDSSRATKQVIFTGSLTGFVLKPGDKARVPDIAGLTEEARAAGVKPATVVSSAAANAANKAAADNAAMFKEADADLAAGKFEEALAKLKTLNERMAKCAPCFVKVGEVHVKQKNEAEAEKAFLQAIEFDPNLPTPYSHLAVIYNGQRKFDEAARMSTKANELIGAAGGGGDSGSLFNQGVILWNAGKTAEAKAEFAKAVKADPANAEAQYWLGMSTYSLAMSGTGAVIDAKAPFEAYLKLAPTGEFADVAKAILATIK